MPTIAKVCNPIFSGLRENKLTGQIWITFAQTASQINAKKPTYCFAICFITLEYTLIPHI